MSDYLVKEIESTPAVRVRPQTEVAAAGIILGWIGITLLVVILWALRPANIDNAVAARARGRNAPCRHTDRRRR
jgi:hypothetical protein